MLDSPNCARLINYRSNQMKEGFLKLAEVQRLLKKVPSRYIVGTSQNVIRE
jgi:hypothetical protein